MPIEIAGISLPRIHRIATREQADFASHRIPGLDGNVVQDMGRQSVRLNIEGIFYGATAKDDLEALRDVYKAREPVDFLADITGQAYFSQIIVERMEVRQSAEEPEQFSYRLSIAEYVPPPQPAAGFDTPDIDSLMELEALDFLDMIQLPDLLSVPGFGDPTVPLQSILDNVNGVLSGLTGHASELSDLYGGGSSSGSGKDVSASANVSIFANLNANASDNKILQLIQGQLSKLVSAGQASGDAHQQSSGGVLAMRGQVSATVTPNIDRSDTLMQGFGVVQTLLPADPSAILGALPDGLDGLFATLREHLVDKLGEILGSFDSLTSLGIGVDVHAPFTGYSPVATPDVTPSASRSLSSSRSSRDVSAIVDPLNELLNLLPDPLDAKALLQLLSDQLNAFPRERIPLQNLPILDELRDKLNTVLGWLSQDSAALSASLAGSVKRLEAYIRARIYGDCLTPVKGRLETLDAAVKLPAVQAMIDSIRDGISSLAAQVEAADISAAAEVVTLVSSQIEALKSIGEGILKHWVNGNGQLLAADLSKLEDKLEERIADVLLLPVPVTDLKVVSMLLEPLNNVLDPAGISAFVGGVHNLFDIVDRFVSQINLTGIADAVQSVVDGALGAVDSLKKLLVNVTVEFSLLVNKVEQAINSIGITQIVDELRNVLQQFGQTVVDGLNTLFAPVRNILLTAFETINNFIAAFDPRVIIQAVLDLIKVLTDILSNPVLLDTIHKLKGALGTVNDELGSFSFRSVTDVVIEGIGYVEDAFEIVGKIPMTDSIREEVSKALNQIPASIRPATDFINEGLEEIVEHGAKPVLLAIKDKPRELVAEVKKYSPDKYLGDQLSAPYQAFVGELEKLKPTTLMQPVSEALHEVLDEVKEAADPDKVFSVLQGPFDTLYNALDGLNPAELIQPLQDKLTEGIHTITDHLPLDAADAVFDQVKSVTAIIQNAINDAHSVRNAMASIDARISGLATANTQLQQLGDDIVAKLNGVSDFSAISAALSGLEQAVDDIQAAPLQQYLFAPLDDQIGKITALDPQNRLISLVQAQSGFPMAKLNALDDSPEKSAILDLLANFHPMDNAFTLPLGGLQDRLDDLKAARATLVTFFGVWQSRYHQPSGPLKQFRQKNLTLPQLKTMLADTVRTQLSATLSPAFQVVEKFQMMLSVLLGEVVDLIAKLEVQAASLVQIGSALEQMRKGIHDLVDTLNGLDIMFIAREIEDIFTAVKTQLDAINPQKISALLKETFDHLLDALDPNTLLGLADLDGEHKKLVGLLKERDPGVLLTKAVQPEFDKIIVFLNELDISDLLNTFLQRIEDLKVQLDAELDHTADAYEDMVKAIPGDLQGELGISVSASVSVH